MKDIKWQPNNSNGSNDDDEDDDDDDNNNNDNNNNNNKSNKKKKFHITLPIFFSNLLCLFYLNSFNRKNSLQAIMGGGRGEEKGKRKSKR